MTKAIMRIIVVVSRTKIKHRFQFYFLQLSHGLNIVATNLETLCITNQDCELSTIGDLARDANVLPASGFSVSRWAFLEKSSGGDQPS